jgi:hypothetical protein
LFVLSIFGPSAVRAGDCPASSPEDPQERRKLAKEWFGNAEQAEQAGNEAEATRAYACSYRMIAHPFTAFNLGRVAERSGDHELALKMFKAYLTLKPDASDAEDVRARIQSIEDKIAAAKEAPLPLDTRAEALPDKPTEAPADSLAPPREPEPPTVTKRPEPEPEPQGPPSRLPEWIVGGVTVAAIATGVGLMLASNSKMQKCEQLASDEPDGSPSRHLGSANDECNAARPLAYAGYALTYGVGIAGIVTEAALLLLRRGGSSGSAADGPDDGTSVGFLPLPGGGGLTAHGRF